MGVSDQNHGKTAAVTRLPTSGAPGIRGAAQTISLDEVIVA
jgi:hypothetical protein